MAQPADSFAVVTIGQSWSTGFCITSHHVLTTGHGAIASCAAGAPVGVYFPRLGPPKTDRPKLKHDFIKLEGTLLWCDADLHAAVIALANPPPEHILRAQVAVRSLDNCQTNRFYSGGFPAFRKFVFEPSEGTLSAGAGNVLNLTSTALDKLSVNDWKGISGGPIFVDRYIQGLVRAKDQKFHNRNEGTCIFSVLANPGFRIAMGLPGIEETVQVFEEELQRLCEHTPEINGLLADHFGFELHGDPQRLDDEQRHNLGTHFALHSAFSFLGKIRDLQGKARAEKLGWKTLAALSQLAQAVLPTCFTRDFAYAFTEVPGPELGPSAALCDPVLYECVQAKAEDRMAVFMLAGKHLACKTILPGVPFPDGGDPVVLRRATEDAVLTSFLTTPGERDDLQRNIDLANANISERASGEFGTRTVFPILLDSTDVERYTSTITDLRSTFPDLVFLVFTTNNEGERELDLIRQICRSAEPSDFDATG